MRPTMSLVIAAVLGAFGWGQTLDGVIDFRAHSDPDSSPRSIDAIDLARLAKSRGMLSPGAQGSLGVHGVGRLSGAQTSAGARGGVVLSLSAGGLNPAAVERMAMVKGRWGRVGWMPTYEAENQARDSKQNRRFVAVAKDGQSLPATREVIAAAARHNLTLETGAPRLRNA